MHARSRIVSAVLAGAVVGALMPAAAAANEIVPGRPGRFELSSITIDARTGDCRATYESPAVGNLWMRGVDASVRVQANRNGVHVTCRFTDMSHLIEANAELGYTDACELVTETTALTGGWGIATSAANLSERAEGGNSFVMCRFPSKPAPATQQSVIAREAAGERVQTKSEESRQRGQRPARTRSMRPQQGSAPAERPAAQGGSAKMVRANAKAADGATNFRKAQKAKGRSSSGTRADKVGRGR